MADYVEEISSGNGIKIQESRKQRPQGGDFGQMIW